jgi:hypothetical protein
MPTPVEVTQIKRTAGRIEGLGGVWRDRPWYLSVSDMIREIERPAEKGQGTSNNSGSFVEFAGATLRRPFCS